MIKDYSSQRDIKISVKIGRQIRLINIEEIVYIKCDGYVTTIHFIQEKPISTTRLLKYYELELSKFDFIRVNRNNLVNAKYVLSIDFVERPRLIIEPNEIIYISNRKLLKIKQIISN
ncbi:MAG: LytTR family transcriptional regulator DNA-binding domain-containing protein [Salinivirgaceae bacterium]|nr:LytTR family transcriptional regulator DNA-binding domain-containing protein [Salinivirgaceae bacterium]